MRIAATFEKMLYTDKGTAEITFSTAERTAAEELRKLGTGGLLDVKVEPHKEKRTYRANAYFWTLANKLANKLSVQGSKPISAEMVYLQYVRDFGKSAIVYLRNDPQVVYTFCRSWEKQGMGWIALEQPARSGAKVREVQVFYGSSVYTRDEMARLIEAVVEDCKEQGIETKTPNEIADMLSLMEDFK